MTVPANTPPEDRVLLLDDNPQALDDLSKAMEMAGLTYDAFTSGQDVLQALREGRHYSVAVLDILLDRQEEKMNGIDLLRAIRRHQEDIDVVMITAQPEWETSAEAMRLGAVDYIGNRDVPLAVIAPVVQRVLATRRLKHQLAALAGLSHQLSAQQVVEEAAQNVMEHVATGLDVSCSYLMFGLGDEGGVVLATKGLNPEQVERIQQNVTDGLERLLMEQSVPEPIVVSDTTSDERCRRRIRGVRSCLLVPMVWNRTVEGAIMAAHAEAGHFSDATDDEAVRLRTRRAKDFLSVIAAQIALLASQSREADRRQQAERAAHQQRAKAAAERAKLDYLRTCFAALAEEANGPLWHISGRVQSLREEMPQDHPFRKDVEAIDTEAQRIDNLLREITDLTARPEILDRTPVDANEVVTEALRARSVVAGRESRIPEPVLCEQPLPIQADIPQLKRALCGVLIDGLEHAERLAVRTAPAGEHAEIEIEYVGRSSISDPEVLFSPIPPRGALHRGAKRKGLSLAVCRGIIAAHGGSLAVTRSDSQSTVLTAVLPLWKEEAERQHQSTDT